MAMSHPYPAPAMRPPDDGLDMDNFTPPPPSGIPPHSMPPSMPPSHAPPLPPPPRDLPDSYRATSIVTTDSMPALSSGRDSRDEQSAPSSSPTSDRPRRGSFGFLAPSKSRTRENVTTSASGHTMLRKQKLREQEERMRQEREARALPKEAPVIPSHSPLPAINTFGGDDGRPDSVAIISNRASNFSRPYQANAMAQSASLPLIGGRPNGAQQSSTRSTLNTLGGGGGGAMRNGEYVDPQARTESITSRGRYSDIGSLNNMNSPRRVRRRKDPTPFNVLIVGAKNAGKTSLVDFLRTSLASSSSSKRETTAPEMTSTDGNFTSYCFETDLEGERVGLTLWDSAGFERSIVDLQLRDMTTFIESKFEDSFTEEQKVVRSPGAKDTHIHCVLLVLDPSRLDTTLAASKKHASGNAFAATQRPSGLDDDLDLQVMKTLSGKTTVVPIISKADTLTTAHMAFLKRSVYTNIQKEKLDPLEALGLEESDEEEFDEDSEDADHSDSSDALPIQSHGSDSSDIADARDDQDDSGDIIDSLANRSSSPTRKTSSSHTTPSPGRGLKQGTPARHNRAVSNISLPASDELYIPFSVLTPDPFAPEIPGRQFAWGMADPYNASHCDFVRLRDSVFAEWRTELRTAAREKWYENWRTSRLKRTPQRIRQAGGVTPVNAVPREGRTPSAAGPGANGGRKSSGTPNAGGLGAGYNAQETSRVDSAGSVPRGVTGTAY